MEFDNLHQILRSLYEQMMPLCEDMAGVAKGIAGLGACEYRLIIRNIYIIEIPHHTMEFSSHRRHE